MNKIASLKKFLRLAPCPVAQMYTEEMEVQVNVAKDEGMAWHKNHKFGVSRGWEDPITGEVWKPFRIPHKADTEPEYRDTELGYELSVHAEAIGMTGWNWVKKTSQWIVFDFDSLVNHASGITQKEMDDIENSCMGIPYLGVMRSTSGKGLHIYVFFEGDGYPTQNHMEHAALARSFLGLLSATLGMKLDASVDCVGSIMWIWARRSEGTLGLTWVKENSTKFPLNKIPQNWKDHLSVVSRKRTRVAPKDKGVSEVSSAMTACELEADHKRVLRWFADKAVRVWWWDHDNQMLVGHTKDFEECHQDLNLRGLYKTKATGENHEQNCFAFPISGGKFVIRRFGQGAQDHSCWQPDTKGWTKIIFNEIPTFLSTMMYHGGLLNKKMEVVFQTLVQACEALGFLNIRPDYSHIIGNRQTCVRFSKKDAIISIDCVREKNDPKEEGWIQNPVTWEKTVSYNEEGTTDSIDINLDDQLRHTIMGDSDSGWFININNIWIEHTQPSVNLAIRAIRPDLKNDQIASVMGQQILSPWLRENKPFMEEYPGNRLWNKDCAKLNYSPKRGTHPTWDSMFEHLGSDLDAHVSTNQWCRDNNILTGSDYLFVWCCYLFQSPSTRNPYLFLYGSQNTGKSSLQEGLGLLFKGTTGYMDVKNAFLSQGNFNGEMAGCVLGYMDEVDLSRNKTAYSKLKDWTTALSLSIQCKGETPYMAENNIHLIHTANFLSFCPIEKGDTRITVVNVPQLKKDIPKFLFQKQLHEEAPAILFDFLSTELPDHYGRFGIPALDTEIKESIMNVNATPMERFLTEECEIINGESTTFSLFKNLFRTWIGETYSQKEASVWNDARISQEFPQWKPLVKGNSPRHANKVIIGNLVLREDYYRKDGTTLVEPIGGLWLVDDNKKVYHKSQKEVDNEY